jgi:hypothetical protein
MSEVKVNKISPRTNCGTVQLGDSGDTITIPAGATIVNNGTQTGFGRTGTVDWDTTAKTSSFTAVSGNGYFVNTTSAAITLTLPASPSAGDIVAFKDYAFTFATNNLTVDGNGSPIGGVDGTLNPTYDTNGTSKTFIYVDGTKGWLVTNESTDTSQEQNPQFTVATGGTITTCGDYKIHTFTGPGTFCVSQIGNSPTVPTGGPTTVSYLVVAGGGNGSFGGGGAGGFREGRDITPSYTASPLVAPEGLTISATAFPITVGAGGTNPSIFSSITSAGGAQGGSLNGAGNSGGSGSGSGYGPDSPRTGGAGNTPPVSPPQGNPGGNTGCSPTWGGGGGGGATAAGTIGSPNGSGNGGDGATTNITGSPVAYAGGGGGAGRGTNGSGGSGGGGDGGTAPPNVDGGDGTANTGGGAGAAGVFPCGGGSSSGGTGGSGIVIIRYKYQ